MEDTDYKYDIFIGYSSDKTDLAKNVMEDLEGRFGVKCCFADRDFVPGTEIVENITNFMESSNKVVLLICEEFVKSGWCWYEQQEAFRKYINEKRNCLIPVLLDDVEVPKLLRNLTYIEYHNEADPVGKIHQAFVCKNEFEIHALGFHLAHNLHMLDIDDCRSRSFTHYEDEFSDSKERHEFIEEETDVVILQNYFDQAAKEKDVDTIQCILKNSQTKLSSGNIYNFCVELPEDAFSTELVETVFQKRQDGITLADYKNSYLFACVRDIPCLVAMFNRLGCESLIDGSFVGKLIPGSRILDTCTSNSLMSILKHKKWSNDELKSFLNVAIQAQEQNVIKFLVTRIPTIPFEQYSKIILMMDEETCVDILKQFGFQDQQNLHDALELATRVDMKDLAKEILKQGVTMKPNFIDHTLSFEMTQVLLQQYPWC